jgi:hypothetical protein
MQNNCNGKNPRHNEKHQTHHVRHKMTIQECRQNHGYHGADCIDACNKCKRIGHFVFGHQFRDYRTHISEFQVTQNSNGTRL